MDELAALAAKTPDSAPDAADKVCPGCNRGFGHGVACQYCVQVEGLPSGVQLSSVGRRFGAFLLDTLLVVVTLWIGWVIWSLFIWKLGQTPGKQLLGMRTIDLNTRRTATWGAMFIREVITKTIGGFINAFTLYILTFMLCWDQNNQEVWDKFSSTIVVDDKQNLSAQQA